MPMRILLLLVLGVAALEGSMRMNGQSMLREIGAWMHDSGAIERRPVDVAAARRVLAGGPQNAQRQLLKDLLQDPASSRELVDELAALLENGPPGVQRQALLVLASLKKDAARAAPAMAKLARDPDVQLRIAAIKAVSNAAERPAALLPTGPEMIAGMDKSYNYHELNDLSRLQPEVIETLIRAVAGATDQKAMHWIVLANVKHLKDRRSAFVAWWIAETGRGVSPEERLDRAGAAEHLGPDAAGWLVPYLDDPEPYVRLRAALTRMAFDLTGARETQIVLEYLPHWADCRPPMPPGTLENRAGSVDHAVLAVVAKMGGPPKVIGPLLARRLGCEKSWQGSQVVETMEKLGVLSGNLPAVLEHMESSARRGGDEVQWLQAAGRACAKLGPAGDAAIPILVRSLETASKHHRGSLAYTIEQFGPRARSALPALRMLATSIDDWEARAAKSAIEAIERRVP